MARTDTLGNFLTDVADAIREKSGTSEPIQASEFDTAIENIPSGGMPTIASVAELNSAIQDCINAYNDYNEMMISNYDSDTTDNVVLYTPNANNKLYAIRKKSNGKFQGMWFANACIRIISDTGGFDTMKCPPSILSTETNFVTNIKYDLKAETQNAYATSEYNTLEECVNALKSNTTSYSVIFNSSWGAVRYSQDYYLPYCNGLMIISPYISQSGKRISTNETIQVIQ